MPAPQNSGIFSLVMETLQGGFLQSHYKRVIIDWKTFHKNPIFLWKLAIVGIIDLSL
jgi:hypothetical protein